ncbi:cell division ATP-binding protein FtsE [Synechococcales cyanobacterium C]|uniref:Cell division ATP-binding protein FtsE n=1 Tax=Petrachloros mirabilis ULC683 TaxID=2781853 RepID=A0A8K1ZVX6_9CYAN|nr:cell division ATP-binding protein FtsE [Petrachloros mirabilis]NCJ06119.1 cell division ATP-binding protein FtsE [Petrachloros mirabilis ULC683]
MTQAPLRQSVIETILQESQTPTSPTKEHAYSVQLRGVNKVFLQTQFRLQNIHLNVRQGEFLFITGPSGSGKSTLLKLIYGEERADQGEVRVEGQNVGGLRGNRLSMLRRRLGVVFQDYKLISRWTVAENVSFVLRSQGIPRDEVERRLQPTLRLVGLGNKANCLPCQLSGGEQQRASIARAIVGSPRLLLADEPTGNLDHDNAMQVLGILKKLNELGITVMITTHDLYLIERGQARVAHLNQGRLEVLSSEQVTPCEP